MASGIERIGVQERIAGTIGQRDEPEALLRVEPFDGRVVLRAKSRRGRPGLHGSWQIPRWRAIEREVVIEAAAPGWASTSAVVHIQETVVLMTIAVAHADADQTGGPISQAPG